MKKILISGCTGQTGSFLAEYCLELGHEVHGIIRRTSQPLDSNIQHIKEKIIWHPADMTDAGSIHNAIEQSKPDEIYNLAGMSQVRWSYDVPTMTFDVNTLGLLRIIESVRSLKLDCKIYQASSSEMFGKVQEIPQKETTPFYPRSPYGCFPDGTTIVCKVKRKNRYYPEVDILSSKKIEDIQIGDKVLSYNENTRVKEEDEVINIMKRKSNHLYTILCSNGNKIKCTEEHPFYVIDGCGGGNWVEAKDLKNTDNLIQYKYNGLSARLNSLNHNYRSFINKDGEKIKRKGSSYDEMYGTEKADIIKNKIGQEIPWNKGIKTGVASPNKGKKASDETRKKMSDKKKLCYQNGFKPWNTGLTKDNNETLMGMSIKNAATSCSKRPELREKIRDKITQLWQNKEYVDRMIIAQNRKINKGEQKLLNLLNEWFPDNFKYVGDGNLWIGNPAKNPDFIHKIFNKVIEYNGSHWHKGEDCSKREKEFNKNNFDCLTIWDYELKDKSTLFNKVNTYLYNPKIEIVSITEIQKEDVDCDVYNIETKNNHNYFAYGLLVHNCSKAAAFYMARTYRESYGMKIYSGILFNHESERRGEEFLSRKVCKAVAEIVNGKREKLVLGNLNASRDWGYAKEYAKWIYEIVQYPTPDDFVIATGETHSVKEFVELAFKYAGIENWEEYVDYDKTLTRPAEVDILIGDATKSRNILEFEPKVRFHELVKIMIDHELSKYK